MKVIYLTYANDETNPLQHLVDECDEVNRILTDRKLKRQFLLEIDAHAKLDNIAYRVNKYQNDLEFFSFSGHAGRDSILTEGNRSRAEGIAHLLGLCPNLKVVMLNGCSTIGQVQGLLDNGIPCVIATHAPVGDESAKDFAIALFRSLNEQNSLSMAFEHAKARILLSIEKQFIDNRSAGRSIGNIKDEDWGLFWKDGVIEEWQLSLEYLTELEELGLREELTLYIEKLNFFKKQQAVTTDADTKFSLSKKIHEIEETCLQLKKKLNI